MRTYIQALIVALFMIVSSNVIAQQKPQAQLIAVDSNTPKLPNVQQTGLRAPANIKIDGKAIEWANKFQAYNDTTGIFYVMANDDKNIYFTIKATQPDVIDRIVQGGLVLSIQAADKNIAVTYPVSITKDRLFLILRDIRGLSKDSLAKNAANAFEKNNIRLQQKFIQIGVDMGKGADTILLDNKLGVKAAAAITIDRIYTQQMIVPLKLFGLSGTTASKINYNIKLIGSLFMAGATINFVTVKNPTPQQ